MIPLANAGSTPIASVASVASAVRRCFSENKAADCVFVVGSNIASSTVDDLALRALREGLDTAFIGDGKSLVTEEMIQKARRDGIIGPNTEVICLFHGAEVMDDTDKAKKHVVQVGCEYDNVKSQTKLTRRPTRKLVEQFRKPLDNSNNNSSQQEVWTGNVHIFSCRARALEKEFVNQTRDSVDTVNSSKPIWTRGNLMLHAGKKSLNSVVVERNIFYLLEHLGQRKRDRQAGSIVDQKNPNDMDSTFKILSKSSAERVTLLKGLQSEVMVSSSPKRFAETSVASLWNDQKKKTIFDAYLDSGKVKDAFAYMITRLCHLERQEKLELLKADLKENPNLAKLKADDGTTLLMILANRRDLEEAASVEIAEVLCKAGSDIAACNASGSTAIDAAISSGNTKLVEYLLEKLTMTGRLDGAILLNALHWACNDLQTDGAMLKAVLRFCGLAVIDKHNAAGYTALHSAVASGNVVAVKLLLKARADPSIRVAYKLHAARDIAVQLQEGPAREEIIQLLDESLHKKNTRWSRGIF